MWALYVIGGLLVTAFVTTLGGLVLAGYDQAARRLGRDLLAEDGFDWWAGTPWEHNAVVRRRGDQLAFVCFCVVAGLAASVLTLIGLGLLAGLFS